MCSLDSLLLLSLSLFLYSILQTHLGNCLAMHSPLSRDSFQDTELEIVFLFHRNVV